MEIQLFLPSQSFLAPRPVPFEFGIETVTVAELMTAAATMAILKDMVPGFDYLADNPQLRPHLQNFILRNLAEFGMLDVALLTAIDERVRAVPVAQRPTL